jgi:hypothetical protein
MSLLNMVMVRNFEAMFEESAEPLCIEICNFVQCRIFVYYLTCYY